MCILIVNNVVRGSNSIEMAARFLDVKHKPKLQSTRKRKVMKKWCSSFMGYYGKLNAACVHASGEEVRHRFLRGPLCWRLLGC
jgi:hypothetical protein